MTTVIAKALEDKASAQAKCDALQARLDAERATLAKIDAFIEMYARYSGENLESHTANGFGRSNTVKLGKKVRKIAPNTQSEVMERLSIAQINKLGRHAKIAELLDAVTAGGIHIGGERPATNLSSVLSRSDRVIYEHPAGWTVVAPLPDTARDTAASGEPSSESLEGYGEEPQGNTADAE